MMETQTSCITRWISRLLGPSVGVAVLIHVKKLLLSEDLSLAKITFSEYLLPTESAPVTTAGDLCLYTQIVKVILSKYRMKVSSFLFIYESFLISCCNDRISLQTYQGCIFTLKNLFQMTISKHYILP